MICENTRKTLTTNKKKSAYKYSVEAPKINREYRRRDSSKIDDESQLSNYKQTNNEPNRKQ